ncbi:MAG: histidine phosphatase family protein [Pirellulales bacterium]
MPTSSSPKASPAQLQTRGEAALRAIRELPYEHVAVVAHGGVLTAALKGLLGVNADLNPFSLFNASISRVIWKTRFQLLTLNQVEHLHLAELDREDNLGNL